MAIAAAATGVFIQLRLAQESAAEADFSETGAVFAQAEASKPDIDAPVTRSVVAPVPVQTVTIPAPDEASAGDDAIDPETLEHNNPRWVRVDKAPAVALAALDAATGATKKDRALPAPPVVHAFAGNGADRPDADNQSTAAIPSALVPEAADEKPAATTGAAPTRNVRIQRGVNLRAAPVSGSRVIKVIGAGSMVGLVGCKAWCEVTHEGSRGYIYKSFIKGSERSAAAAPATKPVVKTAAEKPVPVRNMTSSTR